MAFSQTICYLLCLTGATSATTLAVLQKPYPALAEFLQDLIMPGDNSPGGNNAGWRLEGFGE
jgi:hypothetical protein